MGMASSSMILRAIKAVKLLSAIRRERPDLWREIVNFSTGEDRTTKLMQEVERDYHDYFEANIWKMGE